MNKNFLEVNYGELMRSADRIAISKGYQNRESVVIKMSDDTLSLFDEHNISYIVGGSDRFLYEMLLDICNDMKLGEIELN